MNVRYIYRRVLVLDGNFKADHIRMRNPHEDVNLTNGEGYVVEESRYGKHINVSQEVKQVMSSHLLWLPYI